jgi:hypothetical protein
MDYREGDIYTERKINQVKQRLVVRN